MLKLIRTKDNSYTLYNTELDETYHSQNGALQESMHVFIEHGLRTVNKENLHILETGFGTGLNAILTLRENTQTNRAIHYTALEPFLPHYETLISLDYKNLLELDQQEATAYNKMICGESFFSESHRFDFYFSNFPIQQFDTEEKFDLIYYDAFAPEKQPDMWTQEIFDRCYSLLNKEGILVTYCAKGSVKRMLKSAGFLIESLPGPPGKREMTRATKK